MAKILLEKLSGCVDCLQFAANGTVPEDRPQLASEITEALGYPASWLVPACEEDCEGWFSWSRCDCCGSPLGGERHPFSVIH